MLDLGVYIFEQTRQILDKVGMNLHDFNKEQKDIWIKNTQDKVDIEMTAYLKYGDYQVYLETKINPGSDPKEECSVTLKNGDKITANLFVHWADSCGVFIEHANGTVTDFPIPNEKSTYSLQIEHT
jgi:hypothetical protein